MRFATAAVVLATGAMASPHPPAVSTAYTTQLFTITDCPPEVTDCPAHHKTTSVGTAVLPLTTSTIYSTHVHTITSCAPEVTNCPAHSTVYSTETIAISTTVCPVGPIITESSIWVNSTAAATPSWSAPASSANVPHGPGATSSGVAPVPSSSKIPQGPATTGVCVAESVIAVTKSYTTVLTSVEYSTVKASCPTGPAGVPTGAAPPPAQNTPSGPAAPPAPAPTSGHGNSTTPPPPVTAGAASFAGSALFAAAAGVAAYVFA